MPVDVRNRTIVCVQDMFDVGLPRHEQIPNKPSALLLVMLTRYEGRGHTFSQMKLTQCTLPELDGDSTERPPRPMFLPAVRNGELPVEHQGRL